MDRASHLLVYLRSGHLLQVLQVGVKQVAAGQRNPQNRLDDVAHGAVVGQTDLLRCVHEVAAAGGTGGKRRNTRSEITSHFVVVVAMFVCACARAAHLAHGLIFSASPRLTQKPAPPVANQKLTGF